MVYRRVPDSMFWKLQYSLLDEAEDTAQKVIEQTPLLSVLCKERDWEKGWAASPMTLLLLWQTLHRRRPKSILEFGSGLSTTIFAAYAKEHTGSDSQAPRITSIDHDAQWLEQSRSRLDQHGLGGPVTLAHAPLTEYSSAVGAISTYNEAAVAAATAGHTYDFCFIDGPPGPQSGGRVSTLPSVAESLLSGAAVLLDDSLRPNERQALETWKSKYSGHIDGFRLFLTSRGLAMLNWQTSGQNGRSI
jgi:predicted O-methyltransferase YrrM